MTGKEEDLYPPLVLLCNKALKELQSLQLEAHALKPDVEQLVFHVSDTAPIISSHHGYRYEHKPDIMLLSLEAAREAFGSTGVDTPWDDMAFKVGLQRPNEAFKWTNSRVPVEVRPTLTCSRPPTTFEVKEKIKTEPARKVPECDEAEPPVSQEKPPDSAPLRRQPPVSAPLLQPTSTYIPQ